MLCTSECFYLTVPQSNSPERKHRATENAEICWLPQTGQSRSQSSTPGAGSRPCSAQAEPEILGAGLGRPALGRPRQRQQLAPGWRHRPLAPAGSLRDPSAGRRELRASAALSPLRAPGGVPAQESLRTLWNLVQQCPPPPLALCRSGGTGNPELPRQPCLLLLSPSSSSSSGAARMMAAAGVVEVSSAGSSTDTSSTGEEERMRRLFQTCDGDGDGFISR